MYAESTLAVSDRTQSITAGFLCDTIFFLEGIQKKDRAATMGSTTLTPVSQAESAPAVDGIETYRVILQVSQPMRAALHPEMAARIKSTYDIGMRFIKVPRFGAPKFDDSDDTIYLPDADSNALEKRVGLGLQVMRAIAELADADSIAAHISYGIDYFCTGDAGKSSRAPSILNANHRTWLEGTYNVKFVTLTELANLI